MKHYLKPLFSLAIAALFFSAPVQAEKKMVVALKTDGFELAETDISTLAIGEAKTIETQSGSVVDILRTADGVEIYVDGELLEMDFDHAGLHGAHMIGKHVELICDDDEDCEKNVVIHENIEKHVEVICDEDEDCGTNVIVLKGGDGVHEWVTDAGENVVIHDEIELTCIGEEGEIECSEQVIRLHDGHMVDIEKLHELHEGEGNHKVIVIRKEINTQD